MFRFSTAAIAALSLSACTSSIDYQVTELTERDQIVHDTTLKLRLKDYSSAQFLGSPRVAVNPKGGRLICGAANVKNSFGGYIGYQAYEVQYVPSNPKIGPIFAMGAAAKIDCKGAGIDLTVVP
ncbi:hypothetical protein [Pseudophaeobacter sp.]|uniref:Lipoprotein n=1 Tax=Pseudophaeobacter arcticus TaxID=385492 RepID=A0ABQ0ALG1_9RHOB